MRAYVEDLRQKLLGIELTWEEYVYLHDTLLSRVRKFTDRTRRP
jgi:hypothetical protein